MSDPIVYALSHREAQEGATSDPESVKARIERTTAPVETDFVRDGIRQRMAAECADGRVTFPHHTREETAAFVEFENGVY